MLCFASSGAWRRSQGCFPPLSQNKLEIELRLSCDDLKTVVSLTWKVQLEVKTERIILHLQPEQFVAAYDAKCYIECITEQAAESCNIHEVYEQIIIVTQ